MGCFPETERLIKESNKTLSLQQITKILIGLHACAADLHHCWHMHIIKDHLVTDLVSCYGKEDENCHNYILSS